jgi:cytochrome P450
MTSPEVDIRTDNVAAAPDPELAPGAPLVGNALDMARDPGDFFVRMYREHGPIFRIKILNKTYTVLAGPEANLFMSRHSSEFLRSKEFWQGMVDEFGASKLLVAEDGESHKRLRKIMQPGFARSALRGRYDEVIAITDRMLDAEWKIGAEVTVVPAMQRLVTEQLGQITANRSAGEYVGDIRTFIKRVLEVRITGQRPGFMMHLPDYKRAKRRFFEFGQSVLDEYEPDPAHPTILIDDLLAAAADDPDFVPESDLVGVVLSPYIAGLDTVANTTSSFVYAVLKHPHILHQLQEEVDRIFAAGTPTQQTLKRDMPVLYGALMETLRLYPIAVAAMRTATQDFVFHGYRVYEGEPLYMATAVSHVLPAFYPDPYTFDIGRYERSRAEHRQPGAYAPFGLGPHTCLGAGMAEVLMMLGMGRLFHQLELALSPPDYELKLSVTPTPGPEASFAVKVVGRRG